MRTMRATLPVETCPTARDIRSIFNEYRYAAFIATKNGKFAGFAIAFFHSFNEDPEIAAIDDSDIFHLCLFIVEPAFQEMGLGKALLNREIAEAKKRGAQHCTSFAREGASLHNMQKAGGGVIGVRKNFFNSGETFYIVRFDIA